ncbi:MAG TPA: phosphocholine cytidylyltransferase family protein [Verrucomicrobiae bacterium]|nr:phosphocholine cytidylyltransferase family protein [Verrucomicrobiae bacterium]
MKAVILVAGFGSRLRPLTDNTPKSLLPIGNSNTLERMIRALQERGVQEFIFVTGHFAEKITGYVHEHFPEITSHFVQNDKYEQTNTGYSLLLTESYVRGETFVKFDGDVSFDSEILDRLFSTPDDANYICLDKAPIDNEVIKAQLASDGTVTALGKYVPVENTAGESIGIEKIAAAFSAPLFDALTRIMTEEKNWQEYYEFAYDDLIKNGVVPFKYVDITGLTWVEMDTPDDYKLAQQYFASAE